MFYSHLNSLCRHFGLEWAFVDPKTPIQSGVKFCACVKEFLPWLMMPLQVVYVNEEKKTNKVVASFGFGSGTLQGHLLVSSSWLVAIAFSCWDTSSFASIEQSKTNPFAFSYCFCSY